MTQSNTIDPKIRMADMCREMLGGVNPSTVYRWIKTQGFPKPKKLSLQCSVWSVAEVNEWLATRGEAA
ncbi:helix-turn-helix transcriptional regulator [Thiomicrorhabdus xiamenensis]|uniref:AlpA family phage regulatory protein n=1 Tax=Thiomicrorhabdus xiamenensis TaxID=2739063 RepID=A0A7D4SI60_9GAMM|nr:AlpA family phage regulatory protein [Thiomicrorhabdus xiamenensis]